MIGEDPELDGRHFYRTEGGVTLVTAEMLTERDSNLCLRCHAQVQGTVANSIFIGKQNHTGFLRYGTCWTAGCHTAVHGSNVQVYYLY